MWVTAKAVGDTVHENDPLDAAELEMAQHEVAMLDQLFDAAFRRLGLGDVDREELLTEAEIRAAFKQLLREDPEALELAERLGVLKQFRELDRGE
jgi:hypothetical protein